MNAAPYGYLREQDGRLQISIGAERPADRSSGYATPWYAIYSAPASPWINTADRLPEMLSDDGFDRLSDWLLVRQATGAVYVAQLHQMLDPGDQDDATPVWFARGQESRDIRDVVAWTEIPA